MVARVVIQRLPGGQKNVCLTQDPIVDPDDFIVGDPAVANVLRGEVLIIADDPEIAEALLETELRSVDNIEEIEPNDHSKLIRTNR